MKHSARHIAEIIAGMRKVYAGGGNAMEWCREHLRATSEGNPDGNDLLATLVAYDLQAGSYINRARSNIELNFRWCRQVAGLLGDVLSEGDSLLEVGVGEATTLAGVLKFCSCKPRRALGFDVSWSRVSEGRKWLSEQSLQADLFSADLLNIPLADQSVDVVYSSHSLEPNAGSEELALSECLRVARKAVVLVEPIYELASADAQARMRQHGYIQGLRQTAEHLGVSVVDYRLLEFSPNPLNPSGVLCLDKRAHSINGAGDKCVEADIWRCPLTGAKLESGGQYYFAPDCGLAYPVLDGIPMLRSEHAIVASKLRSPTSP
jgi:SAM-dependent methyltransferase